jgi:hypothetical protein
MRIFDSMVYLIVRLSRAKLRVLSGKKLRSTIVPESAIRIDGRMQKDVGDPEKRATHACQRRKE